MSSTSLGPGKQVTIAVLGMASSAITALALGVLEIQTGFALYSITWCFLVPVGAMAAGGVAASGYFLGARWFHQRPAGGIAWNMASAGLGTYFLVHYLPYYWLEEDGARVKDFVPFWTYLDVVIRNTRLSLLRGGEGGQALGTSWGYAYALLQMVGFAGGGAIVYSMLAAAPYCDRCSRYARRTSSRTLYDTAEEALAERMREFRALLEQQRFQDAVDFHGQSMGMPFAGEKTLRTVLTLHRCDACEGQYLSFEASKKHGREWKKLDGSEIRLWVRAKGMQARAGAAGAPSA